MIEAVIYDMDGVLINSEPFWRESEMEVFRSVGLHLTEEDCIKTMGLRIDEVLGYWYNLLPWTGKTREQVAKEMVDGVIERVISKGEPLEGVQYSIDFFKSIGLKLAIASSSHFRLIEAVLKRLGIRQHFEVIHSAEKEEYGKPHPAVYLHAAKELNINPLNCLVIEDSFNGLISAKAARMKTIAIPEHISSPSRFDIADLVLKSLAEINNEHIDYLNKVF